MPDAPDPIIACCPSPVAGRLFRRLVRRQVNGIGSSLGLVEGLLLGLAGGLRPRYGGRAQVVAGGAGAEALAGLLAVAGAEDVAEVGLVLEGVGVLLGVAALAGGGGGLAADGGGILQAFLGDVEGAGAVAGLALDHLEVPGEPQAGAADLAVAGDVAADTLVVAGLAALDQGLPGVGVDRRAPLGHLA